MNAFTVEVESRVEELEKALLVLHEEIRRLAVRLEYLEVLVGSLRGDGR